MPLLGARCGLLQELRRGWVLGFQGHPSGSFPLFLFLTLSVALGQRGSTGPARFTAAHQLDAPQQEVGGASAACAQPQTNELHCLHSVG